MVKKHRIRFKTFSHCLFSTEAYKGHCVLRKAVLSFVFQTFRFCVLAFVFCVMCC